MQRLQLTPGVRRTKGKLTTADQAARLVASLAEEAGRGGTFGIGGALIDRSGTIYAEAVNAVISDGSVRDPTAHVERQLVDWYFAQGGAGALPPPSEIIIVSSLDPCAMCAGAILKAGFSAIAVAEDSASGVHACALPHRMPKTLWPKADARLALFPVSSRRTPMRPSLTPALDGEVSDEAVARCETAFIRSLDKVRSLVGGDEEDQEQTTLIADMQFSYPLGHLLEHIESHNSIYQVGDDGCCIIPIPYTDTYRLHSTTMMPASDIRPSVAGMSTDDLESFLDNDRACLIDQQGVLVFVAEAAETLSPARSSVLELVRTYSYVRRLAPDQLPHPRTCSILKRRGPDTAEQALMDMGALGSFLERPRLQTRFPLLTFLEEDHGVSSRFAATLPPLYTQIIGVTAGVLKVKDVGPNEVPALTKRERHAGHSLRHKAHH